MSTIRDNIPSEKWQEIVEAFPDQYEGTVATSQDIKDRMAYQIDKYIELDSQGQLTPQYKKFGKRHREEIWKRVDKLSRETGEPSLFRRKEG